MSVFVLLPFCIGNERKPALSGDRAEARAGRKEAALTAAGTAAKPKRIDDFEIIIARTWEIRLDCELESLRRETGPPFKVVDVLVSERTDDSLLKEAWLSKSRLGKCSSGDSEGREGRRAGGRSINSRALGGLLES